MTSAPDCRDNPIPGAKVVDSGAGSAYLPDGFVADDKERLSRRRAPDLKGCEQAVGSADADFSDFEQNFTSLKRPWRIAVDDERFALFVVDTGGAHRFMGRAVLA
jgi:hypothetical protein